MVCKTARRRSARPQWLRGQPRCFSTQATCGDALAVAKRWRACMRACVCAAPSCNVCSADSCNSLLLELAVCKTLGKKKRNSEISPLCCVGRTAAKKLRQAHFFHRCCPHTSRASVKRRRSAYKHLLSSRPPSPSRSRSPRHVDRQKLTVVADQLELEALAKNDGLRQVGQVRRRHK